MATPDLARPEGVTVLISKIETMRANARCFRLTDTNAPADVLAGTDRR